MAGMQQSRTPWTWLAIVAIAATVAVVAVGRGPVTVADDNPAPVASPGDPLGRLDEIVSRLDRITRRMGEGPWRRPGPPPREGEHAPPGPPEGHADDHSARRGPPHAERRGPNREMSPEMRAAVEGRWREVRERMEQARRRFEQMEERIKALEAEVARLKDEA